MRETKRLRLTAAAAGTVIALGATAALAEGATVKTKNTSFSPSVVKISKGEKVTWLAPGGAHTVTFKNGYDEVISDGETTSRKFKKAGTYSYLCTFHEDEGMKGKVVVR